MQSLHKQAPPCCNKTRISLSQWSRFWWLFTIIIVIIITIITIGMCAWWHRVSQWLVTKERNKVSGSQSSQPYNLTATGDQSTTLYDTHYTICTIQPMNIGVNYSFWFCPLCALLCPLLNCPLFFALIMPFICPPLTIQNALFVYWSGLDC